MSDYPAAPDLIEILGVALRAAERDLAEARAERDDE